MTLQLPLSADFSAGGVRLLAALAGNSRVTFQTFDDTKKRNELARIFHGTLEQHTLKLAALNNDGASINFMVNEGNGRGRRAVNVVRVRALVADLDGAPLEPVLAGPLRPHAIVQSSPGRFHTYWFVDGVELEDFRSLQKAIAQKFNGDVTVTDLPRVMRLPGSIHQKHEPVRCELLQLEEHPRYSRNEVVEAFGLAESVELPNRTKLTVLDGSIPEGERNSRLFNLARGFVNKGFLYDQVLTRIQSVNATKCAVPLCATEVDAIVASAVQFGPAGYLNVPLKVFDSLAYRNLSHAARTIAAAAYRRYNGENNGNISLPYSDFQMEFSRKETFYKSRAELVASGLLTLVCKHQYHEWAGRQPDLYAVALEPPSVPMRVRSAAT